MFLKAGVMIDHEIEPTELGSSQGGVISPLTATIYLDAFKTKVRAITRRPGSVNLEQFIADLNPVLRGITNYFRLVNCKELFWDLSGWIRCWLRQKQLSDWKKPSRLHRRLRQLGYQGDFPKIRIRS